MSHTSPYPLAPHHDPALQASTLRNPKYMILVVKNYLPICLYLVGFILTKRKRASTIFTSSLWRTNLLRGSRPDPSPTRPAALTFLSPLQRRRSSPPHPTSTATNDNHRTFQRLG